MSMVETIGRDWMMWAVLGLAAVTLAMYIWERISLELTSLGLIVILLLLFHFAPVIDETGAPLLTSRRLLEGFANPALLTVMALLVVGQGMILTGGVSYIAGFLLKVGPRNKWVMIGIALFVVLCLSAFLNNTPVVVIFIPIIQALAERDTQSPSALMIPLSFAAILGGMTTLIGSSTNLLVSSALIDLDLPPLHFFQFTGIGLILAGVGFVYVVGIAPPYSAEPGLFKIPFYRRGRQAIHRADYGRSRLAVDRHIFHRRFAERASQCHHPKWSCGERAFGVAAFK